MKKKERSSTKTATTASDEVDLKLLIQQHSQYFDKLVELIPARFYLPVGDQKPWFQGLSKVAKASAKKETRENIKKARRARLDPEKSSGTLDLLKKNLEENEEKEEKEGKELGVTKKPIQREGSLTYEELRERFNRRMEELKRNRKAGPEDESNRMKKRQINQGKRKRYEESGEKRDKKKKKEEEVKAEASAKALEKDVSEAAEGLTFGHVKIGDEDETHRKKKKLSKLQALEKAKRLEEAKKDPEKGEIVSKKHSWNAATSRAAGIKVHDDPKLIKLSIKKEKKQHEKNVGKWKDRVETVHKVRVEKQKKRSENIAGRVHEKKMRKIEKREKKLMRPGFEGRKEGFINET